MGWSSQSESCGFESQQHILDGPFSYKFVVKIVMYVWKKTENKLKNSGVGPICLWNKNPYPSTEVTEV